MLGLISGFVFLVFFSGEAAEARTEEKNSAFKIKAVTSLFFLK